MKCQSEGGRYPAELVRGRQEQPSDEWAYEGIVVVDHVQGEIKRIALTPRYAVIELVDGPRVRYSLVDLEDEKAEPVFLEEEAERRNALAERGEGQTPLKFQSFEEVYAERVSWWKRYGPGLACMGFCLLVMVAGLTGLRWLSRRPIPGRWE